MTCEPAPVDALDDALASLRSLPSRLADETGVVLGRVRLNQLDPGDAGRLQGVMDPRPTTLRADVDPAETLVRMDSRHVAARLITDPDGVLSGELRRQA